MTRRTATASGPRLLRVHGLSGRVTNMELFFDLGGHPVTPAPAPASAGAPATEPGDGG
jgi:hypothetical protein